LKHASRASDGTWSTEPIDTDVAWETSIVVDQDGGLHVMYFDSSDADLKHAYKATATSTWTTEVVESVGDYRWQVALAVTATNELHATYFDHGTNEIRYAHRPAGGAWATAMIAASSSSGPYSSLAAGPTGDLHLAFVGAAGINYGHLAPGGAWVVTPIDADGGTDTTITVDASNVAHIAYEAYVNFGVDYASAPPGGSWNPTLIPGLDGADNTPSIAVGKDGTVHVIYRDSGNGHLREARRTAGVWSSLEVAPPGGGIAETPQLVQDTNGSLHVAFGATTSNQNSLRYATACVP
jgi:hypothetical protein